MELTMTDFPDPAVVGENITKVATIRNLGPNDALLVDFADFLGGTANPQFVSATPSQGTCQFDPDPDARVISCSGLDIPVGGQVTITIVVRPTQTGTVTDDGVTVGFVTIDPNPDNDRAFTTTTVIAAPPPPPPGAPAPAPEVCPPVTQEFELEEAHSGDAEPSTSVSNAGDSTNLTATPLQSNTGNVQNAQGVNQCAVGESGDIELSGSSLEMSPGLEAASEQAIEQAAAS